MCEEEARKMRVRFDFSVFTPHLSVLLRQDLERTRSASMTMTMSLTVSTTTTDGKVALQGVAAENSGKEIAHRRCEQIEKQNETKRHK
jgi:hypothetical protein